MIDFADRAFRFSRLAYIAPMEDQPMVRILAIFLRNGFEQFQFDFQHILAACEPGAD